MTIKSSVRYSGETETAAANKLHVEAARREDISRITDD